MTIHNNSIAGEDALNLGDNNHSSNPAPPEYVATWTCYSLPKGKCTRRHPISVVDLAHPLLGALQAFQNTLVNMSYF